MLVVRTERRLHRCIPGYQVPGTWYDAAVVRTGMICQGVKGASPPTWAVSAGPKDNNLEVKLYWDNVHGMWV